LPEHDVCKAVQVVAVDHSVNDVISRSTCAPKLRQWGSARVICRCASACRRPGDRLGGEACLPRVVRGAGAEQQLPPRRRWRALHDLGIAAAAFPVRMRASPAWRRPRAWAVRERRQHHIRVGDVAMRRSNRSSGVSAS
jgi:hypothetical protein